MTFSREARPFVFPFVALAAALLLFGELGWAAAAAATAVAVLLFFRDPRRHFDGPPETVIAAADGLVTRVDQVEDPALGAGKRHRVVTFLSGFDVHVQRTPVEGEVITSTHKPGRKVAAFRADAADVNENILTVIRRDDGDLVGIRQVAGLMARRVVCYLSQNQTVSRGEHLGIIKFGSRVDLLLPESYEILVKKGDRLRNGETPVAVPTRQR